ncbi:GatB/YqeY domain-containing protein [Lentibacillus cibarius]|uniref:GatB/YqeY domain-containing protein n=1 Tax=Lentibacillus cibarius TaxID=2583219 RepID=A0A5S3QIF5_9BACI|nr:GatB/YqeY domain-containing protein [Lentibacillus cibarius]TMN21001.1 GatB/YqeY domain-containing protein [Lentibacillus cibarius]
MPLVEQLNEDMKQAMKNKEKDRLAVIRILKASLQNETIKLGNKNLSEDEELTVLSRELKQRKDSLQDFKSAEREDLISKLETEINVIEAYMPHQLTDEELEAVVTSTIQEVNASSKKDMGTVMNAIMPKVKGKADGARINKMVQKHLNA